MTPIQTLWLTVFLPLALVALTWAMIYSNAVFRHVQKRSFDLRSDFPFEAVDGRDPSLRIGRIFFIVWAALDFLLSLYLLASLPAHTFLLHGATVFAISVLARDIAFIFLFFVPAFHFKFHFTAFSLSTGFTVFSSAISVILCLNVREYIGVPAYVCAAVLGVIGIAVLVLMLNPKLSNWAKLDSSVDESGAVVEKRPKIFILAFTEWLVFFSAIALSTLSLIAFILFDLL